MKTNLIHSVSVRRALLTIVGIGAAGAVTAVRARQRASSTLRVFGLSRTSLALGIIPI